MNTAPQLNLFSKSLWAASEEFHQKNPWVLHELARMALDLKKEGYEHWSVDSLLHVLRFTCRRQINKDGSGFRLNNNHSSFYARKLMEEYPELRGFFELRVRRAA